MPNYHRTWKCSACKKAIPVPATTCSSSSGSDSSDEDTDAAITKVCEGETDKTGAFAKMTDSHFDLITSPTGWLDCNIIKQAQVLLQLEYVAIDGFQQPTLGQIRNFDVVSSKFVQILHTGNSHWVLLLMLFRIYECFFNN